MSHTSVCPCQSGKSYADCCESYISGQEQAPTPEALMRSRFSAFAKLEMDYVKRTTDPQVLNKIDFRANEAWAKESEFFQLEILAASEEGNKGNVEFKAHYRNKTDNSSHVHHEYSKFRKQNGQWFFREGRVAEPEEV